MKKLTVSLFLIVALLLVSIPVMAERSIGNEDYKYIDSTKKEGVLLQAEEIRLNDFRIMPVIEDLGLVNDPKYFFKKNIDFPLGFRYFILKIENRQGERKYIPVEFEEAGTRFGNNYWLYKADGYFYGVNVDINYLFTKKQYSKDPDINYLEMSVTLQSERDIYNEFEFVNYFLANRYIEGKGFVYAMSNFNEEKEMYDNVIMKLWRGDLQKAFNVRTYQGEDKYQSVQFKMKLGGIRKGFTTRLGRIDLFYKTTEEPEEAVEYFERLLY